jgi:sugar lactone lactonase YvrE
MSGFEFPDGVEIGKDGHVYLTDLSAGKVYRIDPLSGQYTVLVEMQSPDGITFNQDYTALYLAGLSGEPTVWRLPIAADGTPGTLEVYVTGVGSGQFDGIEVDACGNLYICDLDDSKIYRVHPDKSIEVLVDRSAQKSYMPNLQWGRGQGGWDAETVYIIDTEVGLLAVPLGVPGKAR